MHTIVPLVHVYVRTMVRLRRLGQCLAIAILLINTMVACLVLSILQYCHMAIETLLSDVAYSPCTGYIRRDLFVCLFCRYLINGTRVAYVPLVRWYQLVPWYQKMYSAYWSTRYVWPYVERIQINMEGGCHKQQKRNSDAADPSNPPKSYCHINIAIA